MIKQKKTKENKTRITKKMKKTGKRRKRRRQTTLPVTLNETETSELQNLMITAKMTKKSAYPEQKYHQLKRLQGRRKKHPP